MHRLNRNQPFTMAQREKLRWSAGNHISKPLVAVVCASSGLKAELCERVCDTGAKADAVEHKHTSERSDFSHITFVRVSFSWCCSLYYLHVYWKRILKKTPGIHNEVMTRPSQNQRLQNSTESTADLCCIRLFICLMRFAKPSITVIRAKI